MSVILDILGSFVIRAAIVVVILNMMINLHQSLSKNSDRIYLNHSISGVADVIAADIKLAGYGALTPKTFFKADSNDMGFHADTGNVGTTYQNIRYYLSPTTPYSAHKVLYRRVNSAAALEVARDVISFTVKYYKVTGVASTYGSDTSNLKSMYVKIILESNITERAYYSTSKDTAALKVTWERHFFPENL